MDQRIAYLAGKVQQLTSAVISNTKDIETLTMCCDILTKQLEKQKKKTRFVTALLLGAVGYSVGKYYQKQKRAAAEAAAEADILTEEEVSEF